MAKFIGKTQKAIIIIGIGLIVLFLALTGTGGQQGVLAGLGGKDLMNINCIAKVSNPVGDSRLDSLECDSRQAGLGCVFRPQFIELVGGRIITKSLLSVFGDEVRLEIIAQGQSTPETFKIGELQRAEFEIELTCLERKETEVTARLTDQESNVVLGTKRTVVGKGG